MTSMGYRARKIALSIFTVMVAAGVATHVLPLIETLPEDGVSDVEMGMVLEQPSFTDAVSDFVVQGLRRYGENRMLQTDLSEQQLVARFLDESAPLVARKLDAWRLAVLGTNNARAALLNVLQTGSSVMRAVVAEMLGHSRWPDTRAILARLLVEPNSTVANGAVAGLVLLGDDRSVKVLRDALFSNVTDPALRTLIALRLADVQSRAALDALKIAFARRNLPPETWQQVVVSLGRFPFHQTAEVFRSVVNNQALSAELKTAAVEVLINAGQTSLPFLTDLAVKHADADLRASAAWAVGMHPNTGLLGEQLAQSVKNEANAEVRRRLYESLMRQDAIPVDELLDQALTEEDTATQVAAANMLAVAVGQADASASVQRRFDDQAVPYLQAVALGNDTLNVRYRAVFALTRAGTGSALSALEEIERQGEPQVAALASRSVERYTQ